MKLIIDIDEELYKAYKGRPPMLGDAGIDMIVQAIATGKPSEERPQGDIISREALKEELEEIISGNPASIFTDGIVRALKAIDNAPAVDAYPFEQVQELVKLNQQFAQEIENLKRSQGDMRGAE